MTENMENNSMSNEDLLVGPRLSDDTITTDPINNSKIPDFSANSFIFNDADVIKLTRQRNNTNEANAIKTGGDITFNSVDTETSEALNTCNKINEYKVDGNGTEVSEEETAPSVYMSAAIDLFQKINNRMNHLVNQKSGDKIILEESYKRIMANNLKGALTLMKPHVNVQNNNEEVVLSFIDNDWPRFVYNLKNELINIKERIFQIKNIFNFVIDGLERKNEECVRLQRIVTKQKIEHTEQVDTLMAENNELKEGLIGILEKYGSEGTLESKLEVDLLENVKFLITSNEEKVRELKEDGRKKTRLLEEYERKARDCDVVRLEKELDEMKQRQKRLQVENLNFSHAIQKLSDKNIKHKQDLILFNTELKKSVETIKTKNETISRQKTLITLFQNKLGGSFDYTIDELKKKKEELAMCIVKERDYLKRESLEKEIQDVSKRLVDFLNLHDKNK